MMFLKGGGLFSVLIIVFFGWVLLAGSSELRIDRACKPVPWSGSLVASLTDLTYPPLSKTVDEWVELAEFSCQYSLWRLFFEDAWLEAQENEANKERQKFLQSKKNTYHVD